MDNKITTYSTFCNLVDIDTKDHKLKDIAILFLSAMNDWKKTDTTYIAKFVTDIKEYFGTPLTIDKIILKKFDGSNGWELEAGQSIANLIDISNTFYSAKDFDKIISNILNYYEQEFSKVDFIAELKFFTSEQGGRQTPAQSGYRPQLKFNYTEMLSSGQLTFIDKQIVHPGDTVSAKIKIVSPQFFTASLIEEMPFDFREESKVIGTGVIKSIINDELEKKPAGKSK